VSSRQRRVERIEAGVRTAAEDAVVDEAALVIEARGTNVATIMRTPGHDVELVRGLLLAEGVACDGEAGASGPMTGGAALRCGAAGPIEQIAPDRVRVDADPGAFAARGLVASAACGVCGREVIADLELRAAEVTSDLVVDAAVIAGLPTTLRAAQTVFAATGGLHAAGLFDRRGALIAVREDVGRHNAVDKVVGWALDAGVDRTGLVLMLSGRLGFELAHKAVMAQIPIVAAVSAPTTLAIDVAERFRVAACGFVRDGRLTVYSHGWRISE
jgi:FdhD protein